MMRGSVNEQNIDSSQKRIVHLSLVPKVSFIIPAYNEEAYLPRTITSIHDAARSADVTYEIIVVDDASDDRTSDVAREHGAIVHRVELRHIAAVRNAGARIATGDVLMFVDADTMMRPETFKAALNALDDGAVGGGSSVHFDGKVMILYRLTIWIIVVAFRYIRWAAGCFIFCRREAFEATGGFDETYYASEEIWMSKALKQQGRFVILREHVITSGRKARLYPIWQMLFICLKIIVRGPKGAQQREGLEFWYESQREEVVPEVVVKPENPPGEP